MAERLQDQDPQDRIQAEIDEILRRTGFEGRPPPRPSRPQPPPRPSRGSFWLKPKSPGQVMIVGGILLLIHFLGFARLIPFGNLFGTIGLILLVFGLITYFMRPTSTRRYWRGERIELPEDRAWTARLYRFFYRDG